MKKLQIMFESLDCEIGVVKQYEWSPIYDEIVNTFWSILGKPTETVEKYKEVNPYLGEFNMKRKTLEYLVNWDKELIVKNILKLGDNLDWNLKYELLDFKIDDKPMLYKQKRGMFIMKSILLKILAVICLFFAPIPFNFLATFVFWKLSNN